MGAIAKKQTGFTVVELLIVIVVIAILATISIVAYNGIQSRARTSAHKADAVQASKQIMAYALQENGESVSLGDLVGYKEGVGEIPLLEPLTGTPDITMYVVYLFTDTSTGYAPFAYLAPSAYNSQVFYFHTGSSGGGSLGYRIDTSAQSNATGWATGVWVANTTVIGWMQVSNDATTRSYGFNQATAQGVASLSSHAGWDFSSLRLTDRHGIGLAALVFDAAHDEITRAQVIGWLADKYNVSL